MSLEIDLTQLEFNEDYITALAQIIVYAAGKTDSSNADNVELRDILSEFQTKIRDTGAAALNPVLDIASALASIVMINIINSNINAINERNKELNQLAKKLGVQITAANLDAAALKRITTEIDKATKLVKTAKALEESLADSDLTKIKKLKAILKALEELQGIFKPSE
jgi:hypothetical protein